MGKKYKYAIKQLENAKQDAVKKPAPYKDMLALNMVAAKPEEIALKGRDGVEDFKTLDMHVYPTRNGSVPRALPEFCDVAKTLFFKGGNPHTILGEKNYIWRPTPMVGPFLRIVFFDSSISMEHKLDLASWIIESYSVPKKEMVAA